MIAPRPVRPIGVRSLRSALAFGSLAVLLTASASTAAAQSDTGTDAETAENNGIPGGIDFGDNVIVDDEGGVRWNQEADNDEADLDEPVIEPAGETAAETTAGGTAGTGTLDPDSNESTTSDSTDSAGAGGGEPGSPAAAEVPDTGKGSSILVYVAAAAALAAAALLIVVRRRAGQGDGEDLDIVEQLIDGSAGQAGGFDAGGYVPSYDGAAEAGAYQVGGAAYAQYEAAATGQASTPAPAQTSARERLSTLKATVVERADKGLTDSGKAKPIARKLEAAGSATRPGEWLVMSAAMTVGAFCVATFALGFVFGIMAGIGAGYFSWARLSMQETKRRRKFADALPETLQLLAGGLRGGLSMMQAIQNVSDEADEPTSSEFQRLMTEARLGRDLAVSLRDLSKRMDSKDFDWVVTAIEIHREVGGDLSSILDRVGNTIRARNRVYGQVSALSAEGKLSGLILFVLPPGMLGAISVLNPEYLQEMIGDGTGQLLLLLATVLLAIGGWWLKKLAKFVY